MPSPVRHCDTIPSTPGLTREWSNADGWWRMTAHAFASEEALDESILLFSYFKLPSVLGHTSRESSRSGPRSKSESVAVTEPRFCTDTRPGTRGMEVCLGELTDTNSMRRICKETVSRSHTWNLPWNPSLDHENLISSERKNLVVEVPPAYG